VRLSTPLLAGIRRWWWRRRQSTHNTVGVRGAPMHSAAANASANDGAAGVAAVGLAPVLDDVEVATTRESGLDGSQPMASTTGVVSTAAGSALAGAGAVPAQLLWTDFSSAVADMVLASSLWAPEVVMEAIFRLAQDDHDRHAHASIAHASIALASNAVESSAPLLSAALLPVPVQWRVTWGPTLSVGTMNTV
jgi:hypothetical protein